MKKYTLEEQKKYYASLDKKRISVGALYFNSKGELLIVKPNYKDHWIVVGGTVDKDESPLEAIIRETTEETSLYIKNLRLVSVEYRQLGSYQNEALFFLFYGGKLSKKQIKQINLPADELDEFKFVPIPEAVELLSDTAGHKLALCLEAIKNKTVIYHENRKLIK